MQEPNELYRLRDRLGRAEGELVRLRLLVDDLREWRAQARTQLEGIVRADDLEHAMKTERTRHSGLRLTWTQRLVGAVVALASLASAAHGWFH